MNEGPKLSWVLAGLHGHEGSIIRISCVRAGLRRIIRISRVPAGLHGPRGEHHPHQLGPCWASRGHDGSIIISISWFLADLQGTTRGASSACPCWASRATTGASSASAGSLLTFKGPRGEHHPHQLGPCWASRAMTGAASASAGSLLTFKGPRGEPHPHQLGPCWASRAMTGAASASTGLHGGTTGLESSFVVPEPSLASLWHPACAGKQSSCGRPACKASCMADSSLQQEDAAAW